MTPDVTPDATRKFAVGWCQVAVCFVLMGSVAMVASAYSLLAVPFAAEFKPTRMVLMLTMTVLAGVSALLSPTLGNLMDRVAMKPMMVIGSIALGAGYAALSFAQTFNQVLAIFGLLIAPANVLLGPVAASVLLSRWFVRQRGRAIGIAIAGIAAGGVIYPQIIQALFNHFAWREGLRWLALILLVVTLTASMLVVNRPADRGLNPDGDAIPPALRPGAGNGPAISAWAIMGEPSFWLVTALLAIVTSGMKGMITNLAPLAIDNGVAAAVTAGLISIFATCGFVAKLGFAAIADKMNLKHLIVISLSGFAAGMALMLLAHVGYWAIAASVATIGLFGGLMVPLQPMLLARIFGTRVVGKAMGLSSSASLLALLSTPPVFGRIFDMTGSYRAIFAVFAVLGGLALLAVPFLRLHDRTGNTGGVGG